MPQRVLRKTASPQKVENDFVCQIIIALSLDARQIWRQVSFFSQLLFTAFFGVTLDIEMKFLSKEAKGEVNSDWHWRWHTREIMSPRGDRARNLYWHDHFVFYPFIASLNLFDLKNCLWLMTNDSYSYKKYIFKRVNQGFFYYFKDTIRTTLDIKGLFVVEKRIFSKFSLFHYALN